MSQNAPAKSIPLSVPKLEGNEWKYVKECLDTGWVSSVGSYVDRFERETAAAVGSPFAIATVNGTAALHISLLLSGVEPGDEVLVPDLTFIAPVNAVTYARGVPVFMDCDDSLNMDPEKVARFLAEECVPESGGLKNKKTGAKVKAIVPVHVFGHPAQMEPLLALSRRYGLKLIEDATESLGSYYRSGPLQSKKTGSVGDFGCFSFNGNKLLTTGGGGMITTASEDLYLKARYLTTQAKDDAERFVHHEIGYNYRLTNIAAAIGCAQLEKLDEFIRIKRKNFALYQELLGDCFGIRLITEPPYAYSNYWFYTLTVDQAAFGLSAPELGERLKSLKIQTRPIWELNHRQRPYQKCEAYLIEKAQHYHATCLSLPCSVGITEDEIRFVCNSIRKAAHA